MYVHKIRKPIECDYNFQETVAKLKTIHSFQVGLDFNKPTANFTCTRISHKISVIMAREVMFCFQLSGILTLPSNSP